MRAYRYNSKKRTDRKFNTTGREKNPNNVKFYARTLEAAKGYETIFDDEGFELYKCELEITELRDDIKLFDMNSFYATTKSYEVFISNEIGQQMKDYTSFLNSSKTKSDKKLWQNQIDNLKNREQELISQLFATNFQGLSDYENQDILIAELREKGFEGYTTTDEIAIF